MKETKDFHDKKDNTGMIIIIIVAIALILGILVYFMTNGKDDVKDAIDSAEDTIENITDNDTKTSSDVSGSYQAKIGNNSAVDEDADEDNYIELVLKENGAASLVITTINDDIITGNYTINNNRVRLTSSKTNDETTTEEATDNTTLDTDNNTSASDNETYEFRINDDDTLTYVNGTDNITLAKVKNDNLKYIK